MDYKPAVFAQAVGNRIVLPNRLWEQRSHTIAEKLVHLSAPCDAGSTI